MLYPCFVLAIYLLLSAVVVLLCVVCAFLFLLMRRLRRTVDDSVQFVADLFDGDAESKFAKLVDNVAAVFSARIIASFNASIRGSAGGLQKGENYAEAGANPLAGLLKGKLGKSPFAVQALSALAGGMFGRGEQGQLPLETGNHSDNGGGFAASRRRFGG